MGSNCCSQVLKLVALATTIGVTKLCMDDYINFHPINFTFIKNWRSRPFVVILRDTYGYFLHKNNGYNRKTFHLLFLESQSLAHSQIQSIAFMMAEHGPWPPTLLYKQ